MIWITPLLISTSGLTIFALMPFDSTKVPEVLLTNCRGSPAAVVALVGVVVEFDVNVVEFDDEEFEDELF